MMDYRPGPLWGASSDFPIARTYKGDGEIKTRLVDEEPVGLFSLWRLLVCHKGVVLAAIALGVTAGVLVSVLQVPIYEARVSMEVQDFNQEFLDVGKVDPTTVNYEADSYMQTQMKMIQSDALLDRVVAKVPYDNPSANTPEILRPSWVRTLLNVPQAKPQTPRQKAINMALSSLKVRGSGMTRLIEVYCESSDPKFAADFLNTLAAEFLEQSLEVRWSSAQRVTDWLTEQLRGLKSKLEDSEHKLNAFTRTTGILLTGDKDNAATQKLAHLEEELFRVQADRVAKQPNYELVTTNALDSLPEVFDDPILRDYQLKYVDLRRQLAELKSVLTPEHPQVKRVEAQIRELQANVGLRKSNLANRIRSEYETARRRENLLETAYAAQLKLVAQQDGKAFEFSGLKRDVDTTRELYESMLHKFKEAGIAAAMRVSNIRVVDRAKPPKVPARPDRKLNLGLGSVTGLSLGVAVVLLRNRIARNLTDPGEARLYLNLPELGLVPSAESISTSVSRRRPASLLLGGSDIPEQRLPPGLELASWHNQNSLTAESYRSALISILIRSERENGIRPQVLLVTSPGPSEGKTTTATNLAVVLAGIVTELNERVLLIDGDSRRPKIDKVFGIEENQGLCDLLRGTATPEGCPVEEFVRATDIPGLSVLPSGKAAGQTTNLLYSPRLGRLIAHFRSEFRTVLIDSPPIVAPSDARILAQWADAVVLVVRSGHTHPDSALMALEQLRQDGVRVLGTILTDWNAKKSGVALQAFNAQYVRYYKHYNGVTGGE